MALRALLLLAVWRAVVLSLPFRFWSGRLGVLGGPAAPDASDPVAVQRVARVVNGLADRVPWNANCLNRALAAASLLKREGVPHTLSLGVRRHPSEEGLEAHAWLRVGEMFVTGEAEQHTFQILSSYSWSQDT